MMAFGIEQRFEDMEEMLRAAFDGLRKDIWTAIPAIVVADSDDMHTCRVKIAVMAELRQPDNTKKYVEYAELSSVPISFPQGGGATMTFPIKKDMEGYVVFSARGFDNWHEKGGVQRAASRRMHHITDSLSFHPIRSNKNKLEGVSKTSTQLRSDATGGDGKAKHVVDFDQANGRITHSVDSGKHVVTLDKASGVSLKSEMKVHVEAPALTSKGTWNHDGGLKASGVLQSGTGLKAPLIAPALPGDPGDVPTV